MVSFIILFVFQHRIVLSIIIFLLIFFIPEILIQNSKRKEKKHIFKDLLTLINNLELSLTSNLTIYDSLKFSTSNLKYHRLKTKLENILDEFILYGYSLNRVKGVIDEVFNIEELNLVFSILNESTDIQNTVNLLEILRKNIKEKVFKSSNNFFVKENIKILMFSGVLLISTFAIVMYPIFFQIMSSLKFMLS